MLAKKPSKNQVTLPEAIANYFPGVYYFQALEEGGRIVLLPVRPNRAEEVRTKLAQFGTHIGGGQTRRAVCP
jgi:hypothetical protein